MMELLAPAGSMEALHAAVCSEFSQALFSSWSKLSHYMWQNYRHCFAVSYAIKTAKCVAYSVNITNASSCESSTSMECC